MNYLIFINMRNIIRKIIKEETNKGQVDVLEVIVLQDIINSDTRVINEKAIKALVNKTVNIIKKCTNNQDGDFYYEVRDVQHSLFNIDVVVHRITFIGEELSPYLNCIKDKAMRMIRSNHDKGEVNLYREYNKSDLKQYWDKMPENSTFRNTWTKDAFFEFYHPEMLNLTMVDKIRLEV